MKFNTFCLVLSLLMVICYSLPVERETLLSIEQVQPGAVSLEQQPQQLRRMVREYGFPNFGYGGYPGGGGYGGHPSYGGYGGFPSYGGGGTSYASSSAGASAGSSYPQFF
ncbi:keratin, type I cytoskeletal 10-like [Anastrepha ludens]|uniref:keratin, type I cytoskeletal 10-like n=1 Tax=Anastrepha ludens TaxID=28586 RepID=UPI0023B17F04|nr:keratin, type I cytoskeletal 10-like [Anastrepha ludens]